MAFPNSPIDEQVYEGYKYNDSLNFWEKIEVSTNPPVNPVAYWSFDETYRYPNDPSGVTYLQDEWLTTDGWTTETGFSTLSVANGMLKSTTNAGESSNRATKVFTFGTSREYIFRIRSSSEKTTIMQVTRGGAEDQNIWSVTLPAGEWVTANLFEELDVTKIYIQQDDVVEGDYFEVDFIYIGDGSYLSKVVDSSGNTNHGTINGGLVFVPGKAGQAGSFNGASSFVDMVSEDLGDGLFADAGRAFSVSVWHNTPTTNDGTLIARASETLNQRTLQLYKLGSNIDIYVRGVATTIGTASDGEWQSIGITWDGSIFRAYLNGVYIKEITVGAATEEAGQRVIIGARTNGTNFYVNGLIDEVRIYNRALTHEEVWTLYVLPDKKKNMMPPSKALSHFPENATTGTEIYRTDLSQLFIYTGLEWIQV